MQMYEDRESKRGKNRCGYCRENGHNKMKCPQVSKDWAFWKDYIVPPNFGGSSWWMNRRSPKYWGDWFVLCKKTYEEQVDRAKATKKGKPKRKLPSCGFCRSSMHNRRNCPEQKSFLEKCYKANESWRKAAYKELVEKHGICVGACISVREEDGYNGDYIEHVGIITSVNFDTLNVMAAHDGTYSGHTNPYYCSLEIKALINNEVRQVAVLTTNTYRPKWMKTIKTELNHKIVRRGFQGWSPNYVMDRLLSPAEQPLDEKWVTDYKDAFDYLVKKRKKSQLENDHVTSLINKWAKHL